MMCFLLLIGLVTRPVGMGASPLQTTNRLPVQKKTITLQSPTKYGRRILRLDPKTKQPVYYDPKPRVVLLDTKSGKYALRWIGYDGKEKTVVYQRPDAIDAVVSASVLKTASGEYAYFYNIQNLPSSGQHLSTFAVQTFASDVKPVKIPNGYVGPMSNNEELKEGNWIGFVIPAVSPGRKIQLKLASSAPPGLVECRVTGGTFGMKGVGEEMPQELEMFYQGTRLGRRATPLDRWIVSSPFLQPNVPHTCLNCFLSSRSLDGLLKTPPSGTRRTYRR